MKRDAANGNAFGGKLELVRGAVTIKNSWDLFPSRISGIYSLQEFLGFIPFKNSWDLFPIREFLGFIRGFPVRHFPTQKFPCVCQ
jgi:hypothetical protein